jgi:hypothetical protein
VTFIDGRVSVFSLTYDGIFSGELFGTHSGYLVVDRLDADVIVIDYDTSVNPAIERQFRVPVDSSEPAVLLHTEMPDPKCSPAELIAGSASSLLMLRRCNSTAIINMSFKVMRLDRVAPGTPVPVLSGNQWVYSNYGSPVGTYLTFADIVDLGVGTIPALRFSSAILAPDGIPIQGVASASAHPTRAAGEEVESIQIRNLPGLEFSGGELYGTVLRRGVLSDPQRLHSLDGSDFALPTPTVYAAFTALGQGNGVGLIETGTGVSYLAYDLTRSLVAPVSVPGTRLELLGNGLP